MEETSDETAECAPCEETSIPTIDASKLPNKHIQIVETKSIKTSKNVRKKPTQARYIKLIISTITHIKKVVKKLEIKYEMRSVDFFTGVIFKSFIDLFILSNTIIFEQKATVTHETATIDENSQPPQKASIVCLLISTPSGKRFVIVLAYTPFKKVKNSTTKIIGVSSETKNVILSLK